MNCSGGGVWSGWFGVGWIRGKKVAIMGVMNCSGGSDGGSTLWGLLYSSSGGVWRGWFEVAWIKG